MVADLMLRHMIVKKFGHAGLKWKIPEHMRLTAAEKQEIIWMVERSDLGVNRTLKQLGVPKTTFPKWYKAYTENGILGLENKSPGNSASGIAYRRKKRTWCCL